MQFTPKDKKVISLKEDDKPAADQTQIEKEAVIQPDDSTKE